jgi:hypothetical protein
LVQRDIINAEPPHKIIDIDDMLLVWFQHQEGFEEPFAAVYLADVAKLGEGCNIFAHNWDLPRAVVDFLDTDRLGGASVDLARVVLDGDKLSFIVKKRTSISG